MKRLTNTHSGDSLKILRKSSILWSVMPVAVALLVSFPSYALTFDTSYNPSMLTDFGTSNFALIQSDVQYVTNLYSSLYTNNVTLNISLTADTSPGALAASLPTYDQSAIYSYSQIRSALIANASTPASVSATNSLPSTDPSILKGGYIMPSAESKALGLLAGNATGTDGTIYVGTNIGGGSSWDFAGTSTPNANDYSFINALEHEMAELMGRTTQLTNNTWAWNGPMDLFRYTAPGVINMDPNATGVYFSTDGGATVAKLYNPPNTNGADIQDWFNSTTPDPYDAYATPGSFAPLSLVDQQMMNTLGWTSSSAAVPEPDTYTLMFVGLGVLSFIVRRRKVF
ncbi:NF038122 family metalloprotease [Ferrovum myxofaciens]|uniref:NF038122 family metalloprotease n=1 Tax=Ferrovum myxofaciens TaxID=416213 RepID=UPI002353875A|nr:NF038122 family metalloprotease [Ferrovum myxofaciens]MBU6995390.1 PEP-CTERM sorting domain-containing protein [Ferrovum myxofaciens]